MQKTSQAGQDPSILQGIPANTSSRSAPDPPEAPASYPWSEPMGNLFIRGGMTTVPDTHRCCEPEFSREGGQRLRHVVNNSRFLGAAAEDRQPGRCDVSCVLRRLHAGRGTQYVVDPRRVWRPLARNISFASRKVSSVVRAKSLSRSLKNSRSKVMRTRHSSCPHTS